MEMKYVKIWLDWGKATSRLKDAEKGRLIDAIVAYANGEDPGLILSGNEQYLFPAFQLQVDRDRADLAETEEAKRRAGIASGEARRTKGTRVDPVEQEGTDTNKSNKEYRIKNKDNRTETKDEDIGAKPKRTRAFVPPTADEVAAFCAEHGYSIDPGAFVDYYARQGWQLANGRKIVDWKACVRTWVRKDNERGPRQQSSGNVFAEIAMELEGEQV